jgi:hypothetical protein
VCDHFHLRLIYLHLTMPTFLILLILFAWGWLRGLYFFVCLVDLLFYNTLLFLI